MKYPALPTLPRRAADVGYGRAISAASVLLNCLGVWFIWDAGFFRAAIAQPVWAKPKLFKFTQGAAQAIIAMLRSEDARLQPDRVTSSALLQHPTQRGPLLEHLFGGVAVEIAHFA